MSKTSKPNKVNLEKTFEQLEKITDELRSGNLDLEQSLKKFEEGLKISDQLKSRLSEIENKMEKIRLKFQTDKNEE